MISRKSNIVVFDSFVLVFIFNVFEVFVRVYRYAPYSKSYIFLACWCASRLRCGPKMGSLKTILTVANALEQLFSQ